MISNLKRSHQLAKTFSKWMSVLLGIFCVVCWGMLILGNMEIDIELDNGFALNAYFVVVLLAAVLAFILYSLSFVVSYVSLYITSKIKTL